MILYAIRFSSMSHSYCTLIRMPKKRLWLPQTSPVGGRHLPFAVFAAFAFQMPVGEQAGGASSH
jgi:hypothetical protein